MAARSIKLTKPQKALLSRGLCEGHDFVLLFSRVDDRIAKNLSAKGLGGFADFKVNYSWRPRSGYYNHFYPNEECLQLMRGDL